MSDNQSWNSSGSEEDIEPREEPGHHVGVADLSGVLSKVSFLRFSVNPKRSKCANLMVNVTCSGVSGFSTYVANDGTTLSTTRSTFEGEVKKSLGNDKSSDPSCVIVMTRILNSDRMMIL